MSWTWNHPEWLGSYSFKEGTMGDSMVQLPFKVKISAVATVTNPPFPLTGKALESLKDRYRRGLPDIEGYALDPDVKREIDNEKELGDGAHR